MHTAHHQGSCRIGDTACDVILAADLVLLNVLGLTVRHSLHVPGHRLFRPRLHKAYSLGTL